jgi:tRNA(Leu) C34 or U34 (ribose-2'-O)-methylase TrmL
MTNRGFASIAIDGPKYTSNFAGVLRSAGNYNTNLVVLGKDRIPVKDRTDTMKAYRTIPVLRVEDVMIALPFDCIPIAVDLLDDATPLPDFKHPERAFYIFGAEDRTLGRRITDRCKHKVFVPTNRCMNLASTVSVILYDRMSKREEWV